MNYKIINWLVVLITECITLIILSNKHTDIIKAIFITLIIGLLTMYIGFMLEELAKNIKSNLEEKRSKKKISYKRNWR